MEKNFNLDEIKENSIEVNDIAENEYTLAFNSDEELKTIILRGKGRIKEAISI